jgi:hypothetical protein
MASLVAKVTVGVVGQRSKTDAEGTDELQGSCVRAGS